MGDIGEGEDRGLSVSEEDLEPNFVDRDERSDSRDPEIVTRANWYAVYTRSRHEKVAAEELWKREIEVFLPLRSVVSKWKDRRKEVQFPLFPGYLFVNVEMEKRRLDILKVPSVVRIIGFNSEAVEIPKPQIEAVRTLVFSELPYDPYPELVVGNRVRVKRGPLRGLEGYLVEKKSRYRFVITVDLIQQAVSCEIDAADVERL